MFFKVAVAFALLVCQGQAELLVKPEKALKELFPQASKIEPSNVALTQSEVEKVKKATQYPLKDKIFTFYKVLGNDKVIVYAGLFTDQVRSKEQTLLFIIDPKGTLQATEVIAYYEPPEYMASKTWLKDNLEEKSSKDRFKPGDDIPIITGATLTTESVARSAKVILAIWNLKFEKSGKQP